MNIAREGETVVIRVSGEMELDALIGGLRSRHPVVGAIHDTLRHVRNGIMECCPTCGHCGRCGLFDPLRVHEQGCDDEASWSGTR